VDVSVVQELACHDTNATLQIAKQLRHEHQALGLTNYFDNVLMPIMPVLNDMHVRGVRLDTAMLSSIKDTIMPKLRQVEKSIPGVNLNSPKQVAAYLGSVGVKLTRRTAAGALATDGKTLEELIDREENQKNEEILRLLVTYHDLKKVEGTYCTGLIKRSHRGRLHTSFGIGPSTGRLASSDPNLQNIPEEIRGAFLPDEGMKWVKADYRQVELYVAALEYKENVLLSHLKNGIDIHDLQQRLCFGNDYSASNTRQRRIAKTVVFGTLYGRGAKAIAMVFGVPVETAKKWQDAFFESYPAIREGQKEQYRQAKKTGIIRSAFGNIRQTREFTKIVNLPVQGGAAGVLCVALRNVGRYLYRLQPLLTVHDEIDFQAPDGEVSQTVELIRSCMSSPVSQLGQFQFPVDIKIGDSWILS
jgi:DNA polymerase I